MFSFFVPFYNIYLYLNGHHLSKNLTSLLTNMDSIDSDSKLEVGHLTPQVQQGDMKAISKTDRIAQL